MSYSQWYEQHAIKHKKIIDKLTEKGYTKEQIIEYFVYENMAENEEEFCPLYKKGEKCHDTPYLNCYFCACPYFRFKDEGIKKVGDKTKYSFCSVASKNGGEGIYGDAIHQDCSKCLVPHSKKFVTKNFNPNWKEAMRLCMID
ncbi:hypothetical protein [Sulfurimonas sp. HSL-1716]|uniref:hypothetical protein n=1 Tax=Hydrocurvibacter sulfurireducens TaxID=3131937 RepID=UPI0031F7F772